MKGVQIVEPNKLQIVDLEKPQIDKENNVLVRMVAAGICGSDVGIYHGTNAAATIISTRAARWSWSFSPQ